MAGRIVRKRCVLLLGKTGAGKSTIANHLVGHDPMSPDDPPFKVSVNPFVSGWLKVQHQAVEFLWENNLYRVTVVDTPGSFNISIHFLPLFPHVYYIHFLLWMAMQHFFFTFLTFLQFLVFSFSFCVEVGFTHIDARHCHNLTLQY